MPSIEPPRVLCVSVHDVAPCTWPQCQRLLQAIQAVANIPVTLLVVPEYHHRPVTDSIRYEHQLEYRLSRGDELALHGYTHLDEGPGPASCWGRFTRRVFTQGEGEFAALDVTQATSRLRRGLDWFERRKWPVQGFVAPAWLLGKGAWLALNDFTFTYTTTLTRFHYLPKHQSLLSPSLVYSARNSWGRVISRQGNALSSVMLQNARLVRLGLHPNDACYPETIAHFQSLIEKLLSAREARTKAAFAQMWSAFPSHYAATVTRQY
jgi:predicted deacetylase